MLEDGEIGEEDFTSQPNESTNINDSPDNINHHHKSKSSCSKRKSRNLNSNKRKKSNKPHHSKSDQQSEDEGEEGHQENGLNDEDLNDAYNSNLNTDSNEFLDRNENLFSKNDYDSRLEVNGDPTANPDSIFSLMGDRDDRDIQKPSSTVPKYQSLMSTNVSSTWSTPMSKKDIKLAPPPQLITPQSLISQPPKSLLDLFLTTSSGLTDKLSNDSNTNPNFIDPVIIEKENKPKYNQNSNNNIANKNNQFNRNSNTNFKRKNNEATEEIEAEKLISTESIEKKLEKKRKYIEIQKEKQKVKEAKQQQVREPIVCKFFMEGRCQKGNDCPFSHNVQINKKYEVCKYYLNGFCAKEDKCFYMHSEFPCKFFHRKNFQTGVKINHCLHGDACRFSHAAITNPLLLEAFEKHLAETEDKQSNLANANMASLNKPSLLGSPPQLNNEIPSLMNISIKTPAAGGSTATKILTSSMSPPSSPPQSLLSTSSSVIPLMSTGKTINHFDIKKQPLLATPSQLPNLMSNPINPLMSRSMPNSVQPKPLSLFSSCDQDVDERSVSTASSLLNSNISTVSSIINNNKQISSMNIDVDERHLPSIALAPNAAIASQESVNNSNVKQELIIKIMKSLADETGSVFAKIPKPTLTELLVKLINSNENNKSDGTEVIINLLNSLSSSATSSGSFNSASTPNIPKNIFDFGSNDDDKSINNLSMNESSHNLQIDLKSMNKKKRFENGACSDYDDDDEDDYGLVIEGTLNDMPYKLIEMDVDPSKLWSEPPQPLVNGMNDPDQESDPRIKYYSNIANSSNVANFQLQLQQQHQQQQMQLQQQMTPTSPSSNTMSTVSIQPIIAASCLSGNLLLSSASSPSGQSNSSESTAKQPNKNRIADPRLLRNQNNYNSNNNINNLSPSRSVSPPPHEQLFAKTLQQTDLLSIQNRQLSGSSLLSALPDLQFPKETLLNMHKNLAMNNLMQQQPQQQNEPNTVKLSIEDYKRKLQKPSTNNSYANISNTINVSRQQSSTISSSILTSITSGSSSSSTSSSSNDTIQQQGNSNAPSLPSIPSYVQPSQAPQSLHELLRSFKS